MTDTDRTDPSPASPVPAPRDPLDAAAAGADDAATPGVDEVLGRALECLAPPTGEEALIRRLADLGASAAPSAVSAPCYRRLLETALGAAGNGGFQSAVAGLFAGPRASELRHCDNVAASVAQLRLEDAHIGFTWALFAALRDLETVAAAPGGGVVVVVGRTRLSEILN